MVYLGLVELIVLDGYFRNYFWLFIFEGSCRSGRWLKKNWRWNIDFFPNRHFKKSQEVWKLGMWAECEPLKNSQFHVYITLDIIIHKMVRNINHFKEVIFGVRFFWLKSMCKVYTYILADVFWTFHLLWNSFNLVMLVLCKYLKQWISRNWGNFSDN